MISAVRNDEQKIRIEKLQAEVIKPFLAEGVDGTVLLVPCEECGSISLCLLDAPKSRAFVARLCRKFARKHSLHFFLERPSQCPACLESLEARPRRELEIGAFGVKRDEIVDIRDSVIKNS